MAPPNAQQPNPNATKVTYAGQTDAELEAEYRREAEKNGGFFGVFATIDDYLRWKTKSAQNQQQQKQDLEKVVENYRPPMSTAGSFYMGYSHDQLKAMVTDNMAPSTANEQGEAWTKIGNTLVDLQNNLTKATEASKGEWQGKAAEAAQGYFTNMAAWSGNAAQGAQLTGNKLYEQSQAADTAKSSMPEPVNFSTADAYKMFFSEPNPFKWAETIDKIEQKFEEKQEAHERAAEVMTTMSGSFQQSGSTMPAFVPPPPMEGSGSTGDPGGNQPGGIGGRPTVPDGPGGIGGSGIPGGSVPGGGTGGNLNQSGLIPGTPGNPGVPPVGPGLPGGPGYPGNPNYPGYPGGPGYPPGSGPGIPPGGRPGIPPGGRPGAGPGGRPGGGPGGRPGGGPGGMPGGGRGGGPGGLAAAGRGGFGPGGFGPGGSAGLLGESGKAGAGGFGPGGAGAGGLGGAGARGGAGMGGMGAGAGKGEGDEDKEHKSASYLVETEDVFGDGTMVAPPVIGG
ncbi:hypothetical protein [Saccharothrix variisporea]|uniref:PPE-repeat protein n=1 Tax=Saccharothrix variisporea TaxID=543527 RepID=A0A495XCZ3_9PSEU|nr:hypothetical protein [Saccharothrix variisporea]RKT71867.1 PPE-repeat protein [Saccharothrix variisporea]